MKRLRISEDLEKSAVPGSVPVTDATNKQQYVAPATSGHVLTFNGTTTAFAPKPTYDTIYAEQFDPWGILIDPAPGAFSYTPTLTFSLASARTVTLCFQGEMAVAAGVDCVVSLGFTVNGTNLSYRNKYTGVNNNFPGAIGHAAQYAFSQSVSLAAGTHTLGLFVENNGYCTGTVYISDNILSISYIN